MNAKQVKPKRVALYVRVNTFEQNTRNQRRELKAVAERPRLARREGLRGRGHLECQGTRPPSGPRGPAQGRRAPRDRHGGRVVGGPPRAFADGPACVPEGASRQGHRPVPPPAGPRHVPRCCYDFACNTTSPPAIESGVFRQPNDPLGPPSHLLSRLGGTTAFLVRDRLARTRLGAAACSSPPCDVRRFFCRSASIIQVMPAAISMQATGLLRTCCRSVRMNSEPAPSRSASRTSRSTTSPGETRKRNSSSKPERRAREVAASCSISREGVTSDATTPPAFRDRTLPPSVHFTVDVTVNLTRSRPRPRVDYRPVLRVTLRRLDLRLKPDEQPTKATPKYSERYDLSP
jgi:hypothetical protein